jgi:ABC-type lipoprotein export system ATPase subunit
MEQYSPALLRARDFAFIFQDHFLVMHLTAFENVIGALKDPTEADRARAMELLERLGLAHVADRIAWKLSGGERQRVAVARAFARSFRYLFADEPTAALDRESARGVYRMLQEAGVTRSVVLVTHDPDALAIADRIVNLRDGAVQPSDSPNRAKGRRSKR